jgi:hypothetical protein
VGTLAGNLSESRGASAKRLLHAALAGGAVFSSYWTWLVVGLSWTGVLAFAGRHTMNPDGMSYVDLAAAAASGNFGKLLNGYWSPAYPALLAVMFGAFQPAPAMVYPLVHLANLLIFVAAFAAFAFFLRTLSPQSGMDSHFLVPFGCVVFLWHTIELIGVTSVTPDLLVAAVCFLAAGLVLKCRDWRHEAALGLVLGIGYYIKAAMFPIGLLCLAALSIWPPLPQFRRRGALIAGAAFLLTAAPLAAALSVKLGRFTIGETGRLNYAWYVNHVKLHAGWTGSDGHGTPVHGPREILASPRILEFAEPAGGTFPLWYEPSYWYEGVRVHFRLAEQLAVLAANTRLYGQIIRFASALAAGALLLLVLAFRDRLFAWPARLWRWQLAWVLGVAVLYALVHVEPRFMAAFFVFFWLALYGTLLSRMNAAMGKIILSAVAATTLVPSLVMASIIARYTLPELTASSKPDYIQAVDALTSLGIHRGDRIAIAGEAFSAYFAQAGGLRIVAQIPGAEDPITGAAANRLRDMGVRALIAPAHPSSAGWHELPDADGKKYSVLLPGER